MSKKGQEVIKVEQKNKKILVVEDSPSVMKLIGTILKEEGYEVDTASDGSQAIKCLEKEVYNIVLTDLMMPEVGGMELLQKVRNLDEDTPVIILTAYSSIETAVEAMKAGAYDYIAKPFSPDELILKVGRTLQGEDLKSENIKLKEELGLKYKFKNIVGSSSAMEKVYEILSKVVESKATVLIQGESGTGKELIAKAIHYSGPRKDQPFVKVDCTTIPDGLLESELFGHEKGAFTGAIKMKQGKFELADGGSVFLDEISETKPDLQAKLLRVLQEREFERVGGTKTMKMDVRLIAATNRDLQKEMEESRFREDLYYRLNVIPIFVPPLRERKEDIPLLVEYFINLHREESGHEVKDVSSEALETLIRYEWPGNVRELANAIERAMVMGSGSKIRVEHLPHQLQMISKGDEDNGEDEAKNWPSLNQMEKSHILRTLERVNWNRAKAAELLDIHRNTLRRKISQYGIDEGQEENGEQNDEELGQQSLPLND